MDQQDRSRLIRYGVICAALLLLAFFVWLLLWRLSGIRAALTEMKQVTDPMTRQRDYYWLGQAFSGAALALAGTAALIFRILEEPLLKAGPLASRRKQRQEQETGSRGWLASFIGFLAVQALLFEGGGLTSALYITPVLFFLAAAAWLAYRVWCWHGVFCASQPDQ